MATTVRLLDGMKSLTNAIDAKFLVVIIPWELQIPRRILNLSRINFYATDKNRRVISTLFSDALTHRNIPFFDLLSAFESYTGSEPLLYPLDRHWTETGHRLAAEALAPVIADLLK